MSCGICLEDDNTTKCTTCTFRTCTSCITNWYLTNINRSCPACKKCNTFSSSLGPIVINISTPTHYSNFTGGTAYNDWFSFPSDLPAIPRQTGGPLTRQNALTPNDVRNMRERSINMRNVPTQLRENFYTDITSD